MDPSTRPSIVRRVPFLDDGARGHARAGCLLPQRLPPALGTVNAHPALSLLGLFVPWQAFPTLASPIVRTLVWLVHPEVGYRFDCMD
jgi:hypothetical protein